MTKKKIEWVSFGFKRLLEIISDCIRLCRKCYGSVGVVHKDLFPKGGHLNFKLFPVDSSIGGFTYFHDIPIAFPSLLVIPHWFYTVNNSIPCPSFFPSFIIISSLFPIGECMVIIPFIDIYIMIYPI